MSDYTRWKDVRAEQIERAGGEQAVEAGKQELLATVIGHRLAEIRRARGLTQQQVADRTGVTKGRISQIEQGWISGQDVLARSRRAPPPGDLLRRRRHLRHRMAGPRLRSPDHVPGPVPAWPAGTGPWPVGLRRGCPADRCGWR